MPRNLDTDLLRAFITVAETGGFTRAAERLNCTQSAVSMQIKRLEGAIQAELIVRSAKGVALTPAGEDLLDQARKIVRLNDEIVDSMLDRRAKGVVRLGAMEDYATAVLPAVIRRFMAVYPDIYVEVSTGLSALMVPKLGKQFDLVLTMEAAGSPGELLRQERPVWARAAGMPVDQDILPIALYPRDCAFRELMLDSLRASGRNWRIAYHSHSIGAVQAAVKEGIAIGVFKGSTRPEQLVPIGPEAGLPGMPCVDILLHRAARLKRGSPANLFGDFLVTTLNADYTMAEPAELVTAQTGGSGRLSIQTS